MRFWILSCLLCILLINNCYAECIEPDIIAHKQCIDKNCGTGYAVEPGCSDSCDEKLQQEQEEFYECIQGYVEFCKKSICLVKVNSNFEGVSADGVSNLTFIVEPSGDYDEFGIGIIAKGGETLDGRTDRISDREIVFTPSQAGSNKNYLIPQEAYAVGWCIPKMASCETESPKQYTAEKRFTIEQPPIFFVHGIWSSAVACWANFEQRVKKEGWHYGDISYSSKDDNKYNAKLLSDQLEQFIQDVRDGKVYEATASFPEGKRVSAAKVDIVSHSMGGLVTRYYIGSYLYRDNIRKFIMMGTPNNGAWGTKVLDKLMNRAFSALWGVPMFITLEQMRPTDSFILELNRQPLKKRIEYYTIAGTGWWTSKGIKEAFTFKGDGVVPVDSVKLPGVPLFCVTNPHSSQVRWFPGYDHPLMALSGISISKDITLTTSEEGYAIARNLLLYGQASGFADCAAELNPISQMIAWLKCPATLHAYDEKGNHLGLNSKGQVENTIGDGAYYIADSDGTVGQAIRINGDRRIRFVIAGNETGDFDFTFLRVSADGTVTESDFENISIDKKTMYTFDTSNEGIGLVKGELKAEKKIKWGMPLIAILAIIFGLLLVIKSRRKNKAH